MKENQFPSQEPVAAPLNLNKFAPWPTGETDLAAPDSQGQTVFIKKTAGDAVAQLPDSAHPQDDEFGIPLKGMLGVITYCYVRGVFSSKEISGRLKHEPQLRKSFGRHLPDEVTIKAFRRRYAAQIEDVLETVYRAFPPNQTKTAAEQGASQTEIVHHEAVERLHDAAWEDNMRRHLH